MNRQDFKKTLIVAHDLVMTGVAVIATFFVRFEGSLLSERLVHLPLFLPPFIAFAGVVYWFSQLYRGRARMLYATGFAAMGIALEFAQAALGYRMYDVFDMYANAVGVLAGWAAALLFPAVLPGGRALRR